MREECVHYHACRRCQNKGHDEQNIFLYLDCNDCEDYVSRYDITKWLSCGSELLRLVCQAYAYEVQNDGALSEKYP